MRKTNSSMMSFPNHILTTGVNPRKISENRYRDASFGVAAKEILRVFSETLNISI
jgi:hypothetical protein